jgi:hypothetical protein
MAGRVRVIASCVHPRKSGIQQAFLKKNWMPPWAAMPIGRDGDAIAKLSIAEALGLLPALTLSLVLAAQSIAKRGLINSRIPQVI